MRKSKFEEEWDKIEAEKSRQEQRSLDLAAQIKTLIDGNNRLKRLAQDERNMVEKLSQRLEETETALKEAEDQAWLSEAKLNLRIEAEALKPFHMAPLSCQYCGGEEISTAFRAGEDPRRSGMYERQGRPACMTHHCSSCGAYLGSTKTLEDSR